MLHDNLSSHKADEVVDAIYGRGHQVICRVPYRPNEAPIEFAIEQFAKEVRNLWEVITDDRTLNEQCHNILDAKSGMKNFNQLFIDCGYEYDEIGDYPN